MGDSERWLPASSSPPTPSCNASSRLCSATTINPGDPGATLLPPPPDTRLSSPSPPWPAPLRALDSSGGLSLVAGMCGDADVERPTGGVVCDSGIAPGSTSTPPRGSGYAEVSLRRSARTGAPCGPMLCPHGVTLPCTAAAAAAAALRRRRARDVVGSGTGSDTGSKARRRAPATPPALRLCCSDA